MVPWNVSTDQHAKLGGRSKRLVKAASSPRAAAADFDPDSLDSMVDVVFFLEQISKLRVRQT